MGEDRAGQLEKMKTEYGTQKEPCRRALFKCDSSEDSKLTLSSCMRTPPTKVSGFLEAPCNGRCKTGIPPVFFVFLFCSLMCLSFSADVTGESRERQHATHIAGNLRQSVETVGNCHRNWVRPLFSVLTEKSGDLPGEIWFCRQNRQGRKSAVDMTVWKFALSTYERMFSVSSSEPARKHDFRTFLLWDCIHLKFGRLIDLLVHLIRFSQTDMRARRKGWRTRTCCHCYALTFVFSMSER